MNKQIEIKIIIIQTNDCNEKSSKNTSNNNSNNNNDYKIATEIKTRINEKQERWNTS